MTMFDGLTMVSYDGHNRNKMMVDHVWTMVDHGRPWSGGQMFAGVALGIENTNLNDEYSRYWGVKS